MAIALRMETSILGILKDWKVHSLLLMGSSSSTSRLLDGKDMQLPDLNGKSQLLEFAERSDSLRSVIQLITPRIKECARQNLPNLVVGCDDCETIDDFLAASKNRPHGKEARAMFWVVCHTGWGKTYAVMIEVQVMKILCLVYGTDTLIDSTKVKQRRSSGSLKIMANRKRQLTNNNKFR